MRYRLPPSYKTLLCITLGLLCFVTNAFAQKQNNIWYFGVNAGLDFNKTPVEALTNGKLSASEGCAAIADETGNLLFYTDGLTVWNRNHNVMANGTGLAGDGGKSSTQILIIPRPESDQYFYVFTMAAFGGELYYSTVDMYGDGGMGSVTDKNIFLLDASTEKITAVRHANGKDIWVIGHQANNNNYTEWLVKANGLAAAPAQTISIGRNHQGSVTSSIGTLKPSPDGKHLVAACNDATGGFVEQFDFDNATGGITNQQTLTNFTANSTPYGVEFSPDGKLLYLSEYIINQPANLYQLQFPFTSGSVGNKAEILTSQRGLGALQIAPNGKIYVSQTDNAALHSINTPDVVGAGSGFQLNALPLAGSRAKLGLPQANLSNFSGLSFNSTGRCSTLPVQFNLISDNTNFENITWDFGDPTSGNNNTSAQSNPSHTFARDGVYTVTVTTVTNGISKSKSKDITILRSPDGVLRNVVAEPAVLCNDDVVTITAAGATGTEVYKWYDNNGQLIEQNSGTFKTPILAANTTYYVAISNGVCEGERQQVDIIRDNAIATISSTKTVINPGETVMLTANDAVKYEWSPATYLDATDKKSVTSTPADNITYKLTTTNANGCIAEVTINIIVNSEITVPNTFTPNADGINDFWVIKNLDLLENQTQVFNNNGNIVFSARNYKNNWNGTHNGKALPAGVYFYVIKLNNNVVKAGSITIIR
ncbi:T9SS type B sorting domain-containing protein [Mucilaginibacter pedocola]|uniref:PKD domain-containing protein n=1 Tax=Mucilaginibacter pedocola TaxID=1792845 RepID=A0A1S9PAU4_9SPHI|nr:gliding motility-associated C-terminal domain-containing protein [Mucilaginibacter pedocola]OOQ57937.1 hypothetical protein BC343_09675 [Mucilaginibacter pedocola]